MSEHTNPAEHKTHVVSLANLVVVFASLLVLTVITVAARYVEAGDWNLAIALAIALAKASLVVLYFMHLRWDSYFNAIALVAGLLFVVLFIGITLADTVEYAPTVDAWQRITETELISPHAPSDAPVE